jgi:hypothetical protein
MKEAERIDMEEAQFPGHTPVFYGKPDDAEDKETYLESHKLNCECARKLDKALGDHFEGFSLDTNAVLDDMKEYSTERISILLANTIRLREGDGRFSPKSVEWAQNVDLPESSRVQNTMELLGSHSVWVDGMVNGMRTMELRRADENQCQLEQHEQGSPREGEDEKAEKSFTSYDDEQRVVLPPRDMPNPTEEDLSEMPQIERAEQVNMAEVQAAEMKASVIHGLDRSADGNTQIEGQDMGYAEEGYVAAADQVQYEAQRARTADGERKARGTEKPEETISPKIGQRVTFQPYNTETKLTGQVVDMDDQTVTLQCGRAAVPAIRNMGTFMEAPELAPTHTKEYAKEQAQKHVGEQGSVFLAKGKDVAYKGVIAELTPTFAIQKVNAETAILHRLKDLEAREKGGNGLIQEGREVSITREGQEKGGTVIEPWDQDREERQKVRELERSRGSQSH